MFAYRSGQEAFVQDQVNVFELVLDFIQLICVNGRKLNNQLGVQFPIVAHLVAIYYFWTQLTSITFIHENFQSFD